MSHHTPFDKLICRVRSGDDRAAEELVRLYEPHVLRAARIRMNQPRLRQVLDSVDICQSVWARFFTRAANGQFCLETPEQLIALLAKMAENRIYDWQRRQSSLRRDKKREVSLTALSGEVARASGANADHRYPANTLQQLLEQLPDDERRLAQSRLLGTSWAEIARREGRTPDALRMQLRRAADRVLQDFDS